MPASTLPNFNEAGQTLDEQINAVRLEIAQLELTIAQLSADNHEVADATGHLDHLRGSLAFLLQMQTPTT